jgi:hypothetical protein
MCYTVRVSGAKLDKFLQMPKPRSAGSCNKGTAIWGFEKVYSLPLQPGKYRFR